MNIIPKKLILPIKIGTRGSPLAIIQAFQARDFLKLAYNLHNNDFKIVIISTLGDRLQDKKLYKFGGKGIFIKAIEHKLINGNIDVAVHSMKDVPTTLPDELLITCVLPREDVRDAFVSIKYNFLQDLPDNAVIGTSSLRRKSILLSTRPNLKIVNFRGNVNTRLKKLINGDADAILLAVAGLNRLDFSNMITQIIPLKDMLPAVAQGAIGLEVRKNDNVMIKFLSIINCNKTLIEINMERSFLRALNGSCQTPIAALAKISGKEIKFNSKILTPDGKKVYQNSIVAPINYADNFSYNLGIKLLAKIGLNFFKF